MPAPVRRRLVRETGALDPVKGERIILEIEAGGLLLQLRQKGRRTRYPVPMPELFRFAVKLTQLRYKAEREARRKARKGSSPAAP